MKFAIALLPLVAAMVMAAPVSDGPASLAGFVLPRGWTPIDSSEVARRMEAFALDTRDDLDKRQPGNVSVP
jgi:hypothetical protein